MLHYDKEYLKMGVGIEISVDELNACLQNVDLQKKTYVGLYEFDFDGAELLFANSQYLIKRDGILIAYLDLDNDKIYSLQE